MLSLNTQHHPKYTCEGCTLYMGHLNEKHWACTAWVSEINDSRILIEREREKERGYGKVLQSNCAWTSSSAIEEVCVCVFHGFKHEITYLVHILSFFNWLASSDRWMVAISELLSTISTISLKDFEIQLPF